MNTLNRFNWIARSYDKLVNLVFGETLHHAQMHFVNEIGSSDHVLMLGGGSGKFLEQVLKVRPSITVTYVEASSEMIALAKTKTQANPHVAFIYGTQENISTQQFDIIITNFFLDLFCQDQTETLIEDLSKNLKPNGKWLITDFENTSKRSHRFLLALMYFFFRTTGSIDAKRLPDWRSAFDKQGLKLKAEKFFRGGFVNASVFTKG